jgi:hypothetical protein
MRLQRHLAEHRRVAGRADGHGLRMGHAGGNRHQPIALDACALGISAEMRFADAPAI